jgi:drug/metabolite transporter (DMT)-like permease
MAELPPTSSGKTHALIPLALTAAVLGISISGPLVRLSHAEPLAIAVWRMGLTLAVVGAVAVATGTWKQYRGLSRPDLLAAFGAGAFLTMHLWSWIVSIGMTSVAASVVLVNVHPIVVALGSAIWLGEKPTRTQIIGIAIALGGAVLLAFGDAHGGASSAASSAASNAASNAASSAATIGAGIGVHHPAGGARALEGDALAVFGAITVALYLLLGRRLRQKLDVWPYVTLVYGVCFSLLLVVALVQGVTLAPQPPRELVLFAAMAIGPTILGHTAYNWALRHVRAYIVSVTVLGEPVGATLLAALIPSIAEVPSALTLTGGAIVLAGILLTARRD